MPPLIIILQTLMQRVNILWHATRPIKRLNVLAWNVTTRVPRLGHWEKSRVPNNLVSTTVHMQTTVSYHHLPRLIHPLTPIILSILLRLELRDAVLLNPLHRLLDPLGLELRAAGSVGDGGWGLGAVAEELMRSVRKTPSRARLS